MKRNLECREHPGMARATSSIGGMEEKKGPTFFKMIKTGFNTEDLNIPPKFRKYLRNELSDKATLNFNSSTWTVDVEVSQTEGIRMIYFKSGWEKFVTDNSLGNFEFLIFRYEGNMQFSINIFERIGIQRMRHVEARYRHGETSGIHKLKEVKEEEEDFGEGSATLGRFVRVTGENIYNVTLPANLSARFFPEGYYTVVLKNSEGREWEVKTVPNSLAVFTKTVKLSAGWAAFRRENKINSGDTCTFELVQRQTIVVHIDHQRSVY